MSIAKSGFNAWLLLRGLRTLPMRLQQITATTETIIHFLKAQPTVESVIFPFENDFPQVELAHRQMKGACGLLTFILKEVSLAQIEHFCETLRHIKMAVSWGGHESLIIPRCAGMAMHQFNIKNKEHRMLRLYVGLEDAAYIIKDLQAAFDTIPV
ncbi:MAG: PLP-dependent transferase [Ferruginibacter sp.]